MTALAIIFSAALARTLGPSQFRLFFLVTSMTTFSFILVEWGQPFLILGEVARDPNRVGELPGTGLALRVLAAPIVLLPQAANNDCIVSIEARDCHEEI